MIIGIIAGLFIGSGITALIIMAFYYSRDSETERRSNPFDFCRYCVYGDRDADQHPCRDCVDWFTPAKEENTSRKHGKKHKPMYTDMTGKDYSCDTCIHDKDEWFTEPCDGCCTAHCGYEPKKDINV